MKMSKDGRMVPGTWLKEAYWPCACVRRKQNGRMSHIKMNHPTMTECGVCNAKRPPKS